jgi:hypothetical protein
MDIWVAGASGAVIFCLGLAVESAIARARGCREVRRGWAERQGGVYRLIPMGAEQEAARTYAETLFKGGEGMRRDEIRAWLGRGDFDAEIERASIRNQNRARPPMLIRHGKLE